MPSESTVFKNHILEKLSVLTPSPNPPSIPSRLKDLALSDPDRISVISQSEQVTRGEIHKRSNRIAHALRAKGVRQGDFLPPTLPNSIGFLETVFAAWKIGAIPTPV